MNDEEKKAIKVVNKRTERLIEELKIEEEDLIDEPKIAYLITQIEANKTLVNLIEKQSKEIEELKTTKKELTERVLRLESDKFWDNVVSKDKIKAKIEEYEKNKKILEERKNGVFYSVEEIDKVDRNIKFYDVMINEMQSLLEKE